jgi:ATP-dependent RNA helicase DOB1
MFSGVFNDLSAEATVAVLSCLVFLEKSDEVVRVRDELAPALTALKEMAKRIAGVTQDARLPIEPDEYVDRFAPTLMEVVYSWCKGAKFADIAKMTEVFEGTIIRAMRRLEELLRQMSSAARAIGNEDLHTKVPTPMRRTLCPQAHPPVL